MSSQSDENISTSNKIEVKTTRNSSKPELNIWSSSVSCSNKISNFSPKDLIAVEDKILSTVSTSLSWSNTKITRKDKAPTDKSVSAAGNRDTLNAYEKLREDGVTPTVTVFLTALKACIGLRDVQTGRKIHSHVTEARLENHSHIANTLVDMYAKCSCMSEARRVFDGIKQRSIVSWNTIIMGYASNGDGDLALQLFSRMQDDGFEPDSRIFIAALKACTSLSAKEEATQVGDGYLKTAALRRGRALHAELAKRNYESDLYVASTLVDMYAKCGSMADARKIFERMARHDVVSWTSVILGYAESGEGDTALQFFRRMQDEGFKPDARIFVGALKGCGTLAEVNDGAAWKNKCLEKGVAIHAQLARAGYESNAFVAGSLVDMYVKCGSIEESRRVFDRMQQRSLVLWNSMIMAYAQSGSEQVALNMFERMKLENFIPDARTFVVALTACTGLAEKEEGKDVGGKVIKAASFEKGKAIHREAAEGGHEKDVFVANSLLDLYSKCGSMQDARRLFDKMNYRTPVSWNTMIMGCAQNGEEELALEFFSLMQKERCVPSSRHYVAALKACGGLADLETGRRIHKEVKDAGYETDLVVTNSLIHLYGKCASMPDAQQVFDDASTRDLVTWNALISGYAHQGATKQVFDVFERMKRERVEPNGITFLLVLNSCTHGGLVEKGKEVFGLLCSVSSPTLEHFTCMVDLLGRANHLDDVLEMVRSMTCKPDATLWRALLGACQKWNNVRVAEMAFDSLLKLDSEDATGYVLMGNIYAAAEMWEERGRIDMLRRKKPS